MMTRNMVPEEMVEINIHDRLNTNFTVLDVFVQVACHIARGGTLGVIGKPIPEIKEITGIMPVVHNDGKQIMGNVIYVDNYGNVITNITRKLFESVAQGRDFKIAARTATFIKIFDRYSEAINFDIEKEKRDEDGKKLALFNSSGYLELAVYKSNPSTVGSASTLFGLGYRDTVSINFE